MSRLTSNPLTDSFSDGVQSYLTYPTPLTAGTTISESAGVLTFTLDNAAGYTDLSAANTMPRLYIPLDAAGSDISNFYCTFKVTACSASSATGGIYAVGGCGLVSSNGADIPNSIVLPIIEMGGDSTVLGNRKLYTSLTASGTPGSGMASKTLPSLPFYVRVIRNDGVLFAETSADGLTGWTTVGTSAATTSMDRWGASVATYNALVFYARSTNAGTQLTWSIDDLSITTWDRFSGSVTVGDLKAKTWPGGNRIDLSWTLPTGVDAPRYMQIYRSLYASPDVVKPVIIGSPSLGQVFSAMGELIYEGDPKSSHSDTSLLNDRLYYYSLFLSKAPKGNTLSTDAGTLNEFKLRPCDSDLGPIAFSNNRVTGLSAEFKYTADGDYFYRSFPVTYRELDQQDKVDLGRSTGYLESYAKFLQNGLDYYRSHINVLGEIRDFEYMPLGLVGQAVDQSTIIDNFLIQMGINPKAAGLDMIAKRRVFGYAMSVYKKKGTLPSIQEFARYVTGWNPVVVTEPATGITNHLLRTWDGATKRQTITDAAVQSTIAAGSIDFTGNATLTVNEYAGGIYVDWFGTVRRIASNTATKIFFEDTTYTPVREKTYTGTVAGNQYITITSSPKPNDNEYVLGTAFNAVWTSLSGSVDRLIATRNAVGGAGPAHMDTLFASCTNGAGQTIAVARDYIGVTFAARRPVLQFSVFKGEPSWLYEPRSTLSDRGTTTDPFYRIWSGGLTTGSGLTTPTNDNDVIIWAPSGAAKSAALPISAVTTNSIGILLTNSPPGLPTVRVGDYINPNRNQGIWFKINSIIDSGGTTRNYGVEPNEDGILPTDVASVGDISVIAMPATRFRDKQLRALLPFVLPFDSRAFIYYL